MSTIATVFEFDTHEVLVRNQEILIDGKSAVHLARPYKTAFWHPRGVLVDGTLYEYMDLLAIVNAAENDDD